MLLGLFALPVLADTIVLKNGNTMRGRIVHEDNERIVLRTSYGSVTLKKRQIASIKREAWKPPAETTARKTVGRKTAAAKSTVRRKTTPKSRRKTNSLRPGRRVVPRTKRNCTPKGTRRRR